LVELDSPLTRDHLTDLQNRILTFSFNVKKKPDPPTLEELEDMEDEVAYVVVANSTDVVNFGNKVDCSIVKMPDPPTFQDIEYKASVVGANSIDIVNFGNEVLNKSMSDIQYHAVKNTSVSAAAVVVVTDATDDVDFGIDVDCAVVKPLPADLEAVPNQSTNALSDVQYHAENSSVSAAAVVTNATDDVDLGNKVDCSVMKSFEAVANESNGTVLPDDGTKVAVDHYDFNDTRTKSKQKIVSVKHKGQGDLASVKKYRFTNDRFKKQMLSKKKKSRVKQKDDEANANDEEGWQFTSTTETIPINEGLLDSDYKLLLADHVENPWNFEVEDRKKVSTQNGKFLCVSKKRNMMDEVTQETSSPATN
jgi:hypothetical protein